MNTFITLIFALTTIKKTMDLQTLMTYNKPVYSYSDELLNEATSSSFGHQFDSDRLLNYRSPLIGLSTSTNNLANDRSLNFTGLGESLLRNVDSDFDIGKFHTDFSDSANKISVLEAVESKRKLKQLEKESENLRGLEMQLAKTIRQLQERCVELEQKQLEHHTEKAKAELLVNSLQQENDQLRKQLLEVDVRNKRQLESRELEFRSMHQVEHNYNELRQLLANGTGHTIGLGTYSSATDSMSHESLKKKLHEFLAEHQRLKETSRQTQQKLAQSEDMAKGFQLRLQTLHSDLEKGKLQAASTEAIAAERDLAVMKQKSLEAQTKELEERLKTVHQVWQTNSADLQSKNSRIAQLEDLLNQLQTKNKILEQQLKSFKHEVAGAVGITNELEATEESIKAKIRDLAYKHTSNNLLMRSLEDQVVRLSTQVDEHQTAAVHNKRTQMDVSRLSEKLKQKENLFQISEKQKAELTMEKAKYTAFLERLTQLLEMDKLGLTRHDINGDSLLARVEQLMHMEKELVAADSTLIPGIQQQLKETRKQLEAKNVHLSLLKQKLLTMESDIKESNRSMQLMKADSVDHKRLKSVCDEQRRTIEALRHQLQDKESLEHKSQHDLNNTAIALKSLSSEVESLRQALAEVSRREKQLLDFRHVVARMLGLDISTLALADYEIIARMESLVEAQNELALGRTPALMNSSSQHRAAQRLALPKMSTVPIRRIEGATGRHSIGHR